MALGERGLPLPYLEGWPCPPAPLPNSAFLLIPPNPHGSPGHETHLFQPPCVIGEAVAAQKGSGTGSSLGLWLPVTQARTLPGFICLGSLGHSKERACTAMGEAQTQC